jgi:hypothetical protein
MKDFLDLVDAFVSSAKPKKWWVSFALSPLDAEAPAFATKATKHHLRVSTDAYATNVTLCVRGKDTSVESRKKETFGKMLARIEKTTKVTYRLDRAYIAGSPPKLKGAVRDWLRNVRPAEAPSNAFESVAARHGADAKAIARWSRVLEGGPRYDAELADKDMRGLLAQPMLVAIAREYMAALTDVPELASKRAYKRAARLMVLLILVGDAASQRAAERFYARAKKSPDAVCYDVAMMGAKAAAERA